MASTSKLWVGIDWSTELHQVCVLRENGAKLCERAVRHAPESLAEMCAWLAQLGCEESASVHVAIEVPHGPVVEVLLERGFAVYSINPKQVDRFRDRFSPSGAKDDRRDALVLADSLRTDMRAFRAIKPDSPWIIELREYSRMHEDLVHERTRITNRLREQLRRYYPAFLACFSDPGESVALDLLKVVPTPELARKARTAKIASILTARRIRRIGPEEVLAKLREASFVVAPGTVEAAVAHVQLLVQRLELISSQVALVKHELERCLESAGSSGPDAEVEQRDVEIMLSMPGVGTIVGAALLADAWRLLRARDYHGLRALCGIAPVTKCSGKKHIVSMRKSCHLGLRNAIYHLARVASQRDPASAERYSAMRARGHGHARALRTIGDRCLNVLCAMLRDGTTWRPRDPDAATAA